MAWYHTEIKLGETYFPQITEVKNYTRILITIVVRSTTEFFLSEEINQTAVQFYTDCCQVPNNFF